MLRESRAPPRLTPPARPASPAREQVDESVAFAALPGPNGRGACDFLGVPPREVDILTASMSTSLGSVGGFCAGEHQVVEHQRINASGYCFSASLPPYLAAGAMASLELIRSKPELREALAANAAALRAALAALPGAVVAGDKSSPLIHVRLDPGAVAAAEAQGRRDSGAAAAARALAEGGPLGEAAQEVRLPVSYVGRRPGCGLSRCWCPARRRAAGTLR